MLRLLSFAAALALVAPTQAQSHGGHDHDDGHDHSAHNHVGDADTAPPGLPTGLSATEHDGLLRGAGMGMAAPAERHSYPGPMHVLELADSLGLSAEQRATAEQIRAEMLADAVPLGEQVVVAEQRLDALFSSGTVADRWMRMQTARIAELRGQLRAVHLAAHLQMRDAMTPEQIATYDRLRGHD